MAAVLSFILGVFQFAKEVHWFIELIRGTPEDRRQEMMGKIRKASQLADSTEGDTSGLEDILR